MSASSIRLADVSTQPEIIDIASYQQGFADARYLMMEALHLSLFRQLCPPDMTAERLVEKVKAAALGEAPCLDD